MLLIVSTSPLVKTHETESNPLLDDADGATVEVPIDYLRNALWYYDMYFVEKDLREAYEAENETLNDLLDTEQEKTASLEASLSFWRPATFTAGGTLILWITLELVTEVLQ